MAINVDELYAYPMIKPSQETVKGDVVIIGGGPNGLTAAAYLAKAGQKVIIVDRRNELGGGVATEEATIQGGFRHNIHAVYFMMTDYAPVYQDLNLEAYDLKHIHPPVQFARLVPEAGRLRLPLATSRPSVFALLFRGLAKCQSSVQNDPPWILPDRDRDHG